MLHTLFYHAFLFVFLYQFFLFSIVSLDFSSLKKIILGLKLRFKEKNITRGRFYDFSKENYHDLGKVSDLLKEVRIYLNYKKTIQKLSKHNLNQMNVPLLNLI